MLKPRAILPQTLTLDDRHSQYDVSNTVKVTDSQSVCNAVCQIFNDSYPAANISKLHQAFEDFDNLFEGHFSGFNACDTFYHDKQHTLDMTLALARLIDGHERQSDKYHKFGIKLSILAIITALFHDSGYIRKQHDQKHFNGAQYTPIHVSRSADFLTHYLQILNMPELASIASNMVHYTGYEIAPENIKLPNEKFHLLGYMLGTADLIAQMSDRCYLEKCRDRLFPEFVLGGLTQKSDENGQVITLFNNAEDLLEKTPDFFRLVIKNRLENLFKQVYKYAEIHFSHDNLYIKYLKQNIEYIEDLTSKGQINKLSRQPPSNPGYDAFLKQSQR